MTAETTYTMQEGPGWSPDGGRFWVRAGFIYWENGDIGDISKGQCPGRIMPGGNNHGEDFSAWTDEHRAKVKKQWAEQRAAQKQSQDAWLEKHERLVASARGKLTAEELEAVLYEGRN